MYTPEEVKTLALLLGAAVVGRLLFYRNMAMEKRFSERVKIRCLQLLWELPVVIAIAFASFELAYYFGLAPRAGVVIGMIMGYVGMDTIKFLIEDYIRQRFYRPGEKSREKKRSSDR